MSQAVCDLIVTSPDAAEEVSSPPSTADSPLIEDELLVEEISIDGMCGVY